MKSAIQTPDPTAYRSLIDRAAWFDRSSRARIEISGPDRAKFLHNLTTNDVKRLAEGAGQESFVTNPQGKTLAYLTLLATERATILLRTEPESLDSLLPHLNKYGVFDEVRIENVSDGTFEFHLAGPEAGSILEELGASLPPEQDLRHGVVELSGLTVRVVRESPTGRPGFSLIGPIESAEALKRILVGLDLTEFDEASFESLRIEAGTPLSGRDVSTSNLPQEVGRDARSINFVKGCYLGQETVARLDAMGHVNRIFRGLKLEGQEIPPVGSPLTLDGKVVGAITSSAFSIGWGMPIALGYIRVAQANASTRLTTTVEGVGEVAAEVSDLPMLPPSSS
jgi:tRNA-modifying protein YgfZ